MFKAIDKQQILIVLLWLIFTFMAFHYLTLARLKDFDPTGMLLSKTASEMVQQLSLNNVNSDINNTVIHFQQAGCQCNKASESHAKNLEQLSHEHGFNFIRVELTDPNIIPSTPSTAILGNHGELVYFGPFGEGLDCSQTTGYALTMLNNYLKGYSAELIVSSAKGCYCNI